MTTHPPFPVPVITDIGAPIRIGRANGEIFRAPFPHGHHARLLRSRISRPPPMPGAPLVSVLPPPKAKPSASKLALVAAVGGSLASGLFVTSFGLGLWLAIAIGGDSIVAETVQVQSVFMVERD